MLRNKQKQKAEAERAEAEAAYKAKAEDWREATVEPLSSLQASTFEEELIERYANSSTIGYENYMKYALTHLQT